MTKSLNHKWNTCTFICDKITPLIVSKFKQAKHCLKSCHCEDVTGKIPVTWYCLTEDKTLSSCKIFPVIALAFLYGMQGGVYTPPTGPDHQISDLNHQSPKTWIVLSPNYYCITRVWTAVFTLRSCHVENVSRARYIVSHQSHNFYRAP